MSLKLFDKAEINDLKNVWVAMRAFEPKPNIGYSIEGGSSEMRQHAMVHLGTPYPRHSRHLKTCTEREAERAARGRHFQATRYFTRVFVQAILDLLPEDSVYAQSRMEERIRFKLFREKERVFFIKVARGGDRLTLQAQEMLSGFISEAGYLHASSQRKVNGDAVEIVYSLKGEADVAGATIVALEQAIATGETLRTIIADHLSRCVGNPARLIIGAVNTCREGIIAIKEAFPDAIILALILHAGMNEKKYLIGPGCGDVGQMDAGVPDQLSKIQRATES